jgi:ACS family hexuronate transporter-like MFS transporter
MLVCAICVVPIMFASQASNLWMAVVLLSIATAAHQGWSANLFTLSSDIFPKRAVGSVVGIGGMAGAVGGMFVATGAGWILETTGSYVSLFIIAGSMYLLAWVLIHLMVPRIEPAKIA